MGILFTQSVDPVRPKMSLEATRQRVMSPPFFSPFCPFNKENWEVLRARASFLDVIAFAGTDPNIDLSDDKSFFIFRSK
jgi:hypothetical protein